MNWQFSSDDLVAQAVSPIYFFSDEDMDHGCAYSVSGSF